MLARLPGIALFVQFCGFPVRFGGFLVMCCCFMVVVLRHFCLQFITSIPVAHIPQCFKFLQ